jgi:hypothetical protein
MYMLLFLIDSFTCIYKYISGLSFWTFFIFLYFGCFLLNIAWPSLNLWPQDPWEQRSCTTEALLAGRFSLSVDFNLWVAAFNLSLRFFFFWWWGRVDSFRWRVCSLPLSGSLAAARLVRLLRLLRPLARAWCCLGLQLLRPCCWRHCIIAGWAISANLRLSLLL